MRIYNFFVLLVEIDGIIQAYHYFAYILGSVPCCFHFWVIPRNSVYEKWIDGKFHITSG